MLITSSTRPLRCSGIALIAILYVLLSGCSASQLLFFPKKNYLRTPDQIDIRYQQIVHPSEGGASLNSWYLQSPNKPRGIVYFLHGNAENISTHIASVFWLPKAGYDVFMLDYRGFGLSTGIAKIPEVFSDLESGFEWIQAHNSDKLPVYIVAQSLGASLAVPFAADPEINKHINGLVIDAAFGNYAQITRDTLSQHWLTWLFQYPASWLISNPYNPVDFIHRVSPVPTLIYHSKQDRVIPYRNAAQLFQKANEPKDFFIAKGPHIATFNQEAARDRLLNFMKSNQTINRPAQSGRPKSENPL